MSISTPPPPAPPVQKKRGLGCLGCGCLILGLLVALFVALLIGLSYIGYSKYMVITSPTAAPVPTFDGGDETFNTARQKIASFVHDLHGHLPAVIHLNANEINTLIAREPQFAARKISFFVSFTNDQARLQTSLPTDLIPSGLLNGRYLNGDFTFGLNFDEVAKALDLNLQNIQLGPTFVIPKDQLPLLQSELNPVFNSFLQKDPDLKSLLDQAKSIEIKDGELVIEIQ